MGTLETLRQSIEQIGVKEIARRSGLSASTVSRVNSGDMMPSFQVAEKLSRAAGFQLDLRPLENARTGERLNEVARVLRAMQPSLKKMGIKHITVFGSIARGEDRPDSDIDLYVDYGKGRPDVGRMLRAEGRMLEAFAGTHVDFVTDLTTPKGRKLKLQIEKDGHRVF